MGTDIHTYVEQRDTLGIWHYQGQIWDVRYYGFYGWLSGINNFSAVRPAFADRGIPKDVSDFVHNELVGWEPNAFGHSYASLAEMMAVNYEEEIEDRRRMKEVAPGRFDGGATCEVGQGEKMPLGEFLPRVYFDDLAKLMKLLERGDDPSFSDEPENVRVVWFFEC